MISINFGVYRNLLLQELSAHRGDLRHALRSVAEVGYQEHGCSAGAGRIGELSFEVTHSAAEGLENRQSARAFTAMMAAFVGFLDRVLSAAALMRQGLRADREFQTAEALLAFARQRLDDAYLSYARDSSVSNQHKVRSIPALRPGAQDILLELFALRRAVEHRAGRPDRALSIRHRRMVFYAADRRLEALPAMLNEGESLAVRAEDSDPEVFAAGEPVQITEAFIEGVTSSLTYISAETIECLMQAERSQALNDMRG